MYFICGCLIFLHWIYFVLNLLHTCHNPDSNYFSHFLCKTMLLVKTLFARRDVLITRDSICYLRIKYGPHDCIKYGPHDCLVLPQSVTEENNRRWMTTTRALEGYCSHNSMPFFRIAVDLGCRFEFILCLDNRLQIYDEL